VVWPFSKLTLLFLVLGKCGKLYGRGHRHNTAQEVKTVLVHRLLRCARASGYGLCLAFRRRGQFGAEQVCEDDSVEIVQLAKFQHACFLSRNNRLNIFTKRELVVPSIAVELIQSFESTIETATNREHVDTMPRVGENRLVKL
jgi:hypothetical protein